MSALKSGDQRIAGICSNIGMATLVRIHPELATREHLFLETLDQNGNAEYKQVLMQTRKQYFEKLRDKETGSQGQQITIEDVLPKRTED